MVLVSVVGGVGVNKLVGVGEWSGFVEKVCKYAPVGCIYVEAFSSGNVGGLYGSV